MLKETHTNIKINFRNRTTLINKGYNATNGEVVLIKIEDLNKFSDVKVTAICACGAEKITSYEKYLENKNRAGFYGCKKCSTIKRKILNKEKYGIEHTFQLEEVKNKIKDKHLKNLGVENPSQSHSIVEKREKTCIEKYGFKTNLMNSDNKELVKLTNLKKYGYDNPFKNKELNNKNIESLKNKTIEKFNDIISDEYEISLVDNQYNIKHIPCNNINVIKYSTLYYKIYNKIEHCEKCYPNENKSNTEKEISNWLKELNIDIIEGDRMILKPLELDIYIPSKNLAIEFNGLYWHSELYKDKNYHLNKTLNCQKKDIHLLHIWEDEWIFKQNIIKSIILNKLGLIIEKIYARQCDIRIVEDSKLVRKFLDENHIQGYSQSSIKIGLYLKEELVSLMTFGKRMIKKNIEFELIRFCNKINTNVVGASSKLFNYFKKNYEFTDLISYSDFRLFDGKMYETLGFSKIHLSKPEYYWYKGLNRYHRSTFMKHKLVSEGYDSSKTEVEIMHERNYLRIFGCGQYKWKIK